MENLRRIDKQCGGLSVPATSLACRRVRERIESDKWRELIPKGADITGPSEDPIDVYPHVLPLNLKGKFSEIDYKKFEIPPTGQTEVQRKAAKEELK